MLGEHINVHPIPTCDMFISVGRASIVFYMSDQLSLLYNKSPIGEKTWWALYYGCVNCLSTTIAQIYTHLPLVVLLILQKLAVLHEN